MYTIIDLQFTVRGYYLNLFSSHSTIFYLGDCSDTTLQAKEEPGYFTSPGYEGDGYERGQKCAWKIEVSPKARVV